MPSRFFLWTLGSPLFPCALCFFLKHILYHPTFVGKPGTTTSHKVLMGTVTQVLRSGSKVPIHSLPLSLLPKLSSFSHLRDISLGHPLPNRSPPPPVLRIWPSRLPWLPPPSTSSQSPLVASLTSPILTFPLLQKPTHGHALGVAIGRNSSWCNLLDTNNSSSGYGASSLFSPNLIFSVITILFPS